MFLYLISEFVSKGINHRETMSVMCFTAVFMKVCLRVRICDHNGIHRIYIHIGDREHKAQVGDRW